MTASAAPPRPAASSSPAAWRPRPLSADHGRQSEVVAAVVVDHIWPHKGDRALFWDRGNWQSLCKACHDRKTALEDGRWGPATGQRRQG